MELTESEVTSGPVDKQHLEQALILWLGFNRLRVELLSLPEPPSGKVLVPLVLEVARNLYSPPAKTGRPTKGEGA